MPFSLVLATRVSAIPWARARKRDGWTDAVEVGKAGEKNSGYALCGWNCLLLGPDCERGMDKRE